MYVKLPQVCFEMQKLYLIACSIYPSPRFLFFAPPPRGDIVQLLQIHFSVSTRDASAEGWNTHCSGLSLVLKRHFIHCQLSFEKVPLASYFVHFYYSYQGVRAEKENE